MYILGLGQIGGQDSSAVLVKDGELRFAIEEERLTRVKHIGGFPQQALERCLAAEGIELAEVDHLAVVNKPWVRLLRRSAQWYGPLLLTHPANALYHLLHDEIPTFLEVAKHARRLRERSRGRSRTHFVKHHDAHIASAFFVSPFQEAAIFTTDALGEFATTTISVGKDRRFTVLEERRMPHSLGVFYAAVTDYLGFRFNEDEYKVMGMAAYGAPAYLDTFRDMIHYHKRRLVDTNLRYFTYQHGRGFFSKRFAARFGPRRRPQEPITPHHYNLAASAQAALEEIALQLARDLQRRTRQRFLCLAGGVALNCVMNGKIAQAGIFEKIFVQPAAGDAGTALGAAYEVYHRVLGRPRACVMTTANLGPAYANAEIERELLLSKARYTPCAQIEADTARLLAEGKIVGWFQGRMEFGPRALGARSILADPTNPQMKDLVNSRVKHREEFRPFAPAVKSEQASAYFDMEFESPFMLFVVNVRASKRALLPAITHVDGTARVQCVNREAHPRFWRLLDEFEKLRGVPIVLNTSFNVMGEPIVCTPHEAIRCFYSTGLDALAIGDFLVVK